MSRHRLLKGQESCQNTSLQSAKDVSRRREISPEIFSLTHIVIKFIKQKANLFMTFYIALKVRASVGQRLPPNPDDIQELQEKTRKTVQAPPDPRTWFLEPPVEMAFI